MSRIARSAATSLVLLVGACTETKDVSADAQYVFAPTAIAHSFQDAEDLVEAAYVFESPFFYEVDESVTVFGQVHCPGGELESASCSITIDGDVLVVDTEVLVNVRDDNRDICAPTIVFRCESSELAAGRYRLDHGQGTIPLEIPSMVESTSMVVD